MNYMGIDGNVHSDELKHWKYIKKIKSGSGWRYFYTPEEIRAFYEETKSAVKDAKRKTIDKAPLPERIGDKYYIGNKKLRSDIRKSGAGGNIIANTNRKSKSNLTQKDINRMSDKEVDNYIDKREKIEKKTKRYDEYTKRSNYEADYAVAKRKRDYARQMLKEGREYSNGWELTGDPRGPRSYKEMVKTSQKQMRDAKKGVSAIEKKYAKYEVKNMAKRKISKGKSKVEKILAPTSGGTQKSKTISQTIGKTKRDNKPRVTKTKNGTLTSRTLKETVNGRTTVNRPYVPSEKEKRYIKKYKKKAKKDSSAGTYKQKTLKETIGAPKPRRGYR